MKANKEHALFRVLTGSWLYGTATPASDYDYKTVVLPPLDVLLLNTKVTNRKEKPEGTGPGGKMQAGETETEYLPLQVFMDDFYSGQTYALEVAFAVVQGKFEVLNSRFADAAEWVTPAQAEAGPKFSYASGKVRDAQRVCNELVNNFLTRNVKKMVGYAVSQSKLYGLKTERYTSLRQVVEMVVEHFHNSANALVEVRLRDTPQLLEALCTLEHVSMGEVANAKGGKEMGPALVIANKLYPLTNHWSTVLASLEKVLSGYGERVKEFDGEGVDWKALSHAIRITGQAGELLVKGQLTFPSEQAQYLLDVKRGNVPLDKATAELDRLFGLLDTAQQLSQLPERTATMDAAFVEWKVGVLRAFYQLNQPS